MALKEMLGPGKAPPEIVAAIHHIDPEVELLHLSGKRWWLVHKAPNPDAARKLAELVTRQDKVGTLDDPAERAVVEHELGIELLMLKVMADGHKPIQVYEVDGAPGWEIVEDLRLRDHNWRTKSLTQLKRELREATSTDHLNKQRAEQFGERAVERARDAFSYVFRKARSVLVGANLE